MSVRSTINRFNIPFRARLTEAPETDAILRRRKQIEIFEETAGNLFELQKETTDQDTKVRLQEHMDHINTQIDTFEFLENEALAEANAKIDTFNRNTTFTLAVAAQVVTAVTLTSINTIGTRTGNTIKQERFQRAISPAAQLIGVAVTAAANPLLGIAASAAFITNIGIKEYQTAVQRDRVTKDNEMRLQLLGGISQRGNR